MFQSLAMFSNSGPVEEMDAIQYEKKYLVLICTELLAHSPLGLGKVILFQDQRNKRSINQPRSHAFSFTGVASLILSSPARCLRGLRRPDVRHK